MKQSTVAAWVGKKFNRLEILDLLCENYVYKAICLCDCGGITEAKVQDISRSRVKSCGCYRREAAAAKFTVHGKLTANASAATRRALTCWSNLKARCNNPKNSRYHRYGARGITYLKRWESFENFLSDMGPCPEGFSLERHDNNKNYSKSNCSWIPRGKQAKNRSDTIRICFEGKIWCLKDLCKHFGLRYLMVYKRYKLRGWTIQRALENSFVTLPKEKR